MDVDMNGKQPEPMRSTFGNGIRRRFARLATPRGHGGVVAAVRHALLTPGRVTVTRDAVRVTGFTGFTGNDAWRKATNRQYCNNCL